MVVAVCHVNKVRQNTKCACCLNWWITRSTATVWGSTERNAVSIAMRFHADGDESLTIFKAMKCSKVTEKQEWNHVLEETGNNVEHIHGCGFAHNDIKSNNVVLEKC